jgi:hypothetical protein
LLTGNKQSSLERKIFSWNGIFVRAGPGVSELRRVFRENFHFAHRSSIAGGKLSFVRIEFVGLNERKWAASCVATQVQGRTPRSDAE